jgi:undecaprenyl-diphosphatase
MSFWLQQNYHLFLEVNEHAGRFPWLDGLMVFCADSLIFLWPLFLLALWGRPLSWRKRSLRPGELEIVQECRAAVLWALVACLVAYGINLGVEAFLFEPRPFIAHHVNLLISHAADDSFPSDHTAWSFAVVGMLLFALLPRLFSAWRMRTRQGSVESLQTLRFPLILMIIAIAIACSVGVARVFVGVHYPGDILGGSISGLIAAGIVTLLRHLLRRPTLGLLSLAQRFRLA